MNGRVTGVPYEKVFGAVVDAATFDAEWLVRREVLVFAVPYSSTRKRRWHGRACVAGRFPPAGQAQPVT